MSALIEKIRKGREFRVPVREGVELIARRPTDLEMAERGGRLAPRDAMEFVTGWNGVTEQVITGQGEPHPLAFDDALLREWLADELEMVSGLVSAVLKAWTDHSKAVAAAKKK